MKTEDIRPEALLAENWRLYYEDVAVMMIGLEGFVHVPCPACGDGAWSLAFEKDGFRHLTCSGCETLYISPRPTFEMLMEFYRGAHSIKHWNESIFPSTEEARRMEIFKPRAMDVQYKCKKYGVPFETLVDVGAGFGTFCAELEKYGSFEHVVAVEPSSDLAESCRRKGLEVLEHPIEHVGLKNVSVITAFEMIEHLFSPREFIRSCNRSLVEGGLLIMTTPNIKGFDLMVLGQMSENVGGPNHLQFFHPASTRRLLEECGFEVLELTTPGKLDAEIVRTAAHRGKTMVIPFLWEVLLTRWEELGGPFQKFLQDNLLSSHMRVVARKA